MENVTVYKSKDFYISACLLASGLKLIRLEPGTGKFVHFVFDDPKNLAPEIISSHWNRSNRIASRDLIEAINELRTRLHGGT